MRKPAKAAMIVLTLAAVLLVGAVPVHAAGQSDQQVISQTQTLLDRIDGVSFRGLVTRLEGRKTLVLHMKPTSFARQGSDALGATAALAMLAGCVHADGGEGFHQVVVDLEGVGKLAMTMNDFRYIKSNKVDRDEVAKRVTFVKY